MKKKRISIIILLFVGILSIYLLCKTNWVKNTVIGKIAFFEGNSFEVKELSEVVNTMYVTMLDNKARVVATTNPNTTVDNLYKFTESQKPEKQPNTKDDYYILFNIDDTNGEKGYTKVEENIIYRLSLPDYIIPNNAYEEGINANKECQKFTKSGNVSACGGIYQKNGKYEFQVIFNNTLNKKDVKSAYQFPIKLNESIKDIVFNLKTIRFGLLGDIQLYIEPETPPEPGDDYTLKNDFSGYTSNTRNYLKWTATLTDNHTDGYKTNGTIYLNFGQDLGMAIDQDHWFEYLNIYADGELLTRYRSEPIGLNGIYFKKNDNYLAAATIYEKEELDFSNSYSYLVKSIKIDLNQVKNENSTIEDVHEWKFEYITKEYHQNSLHTFQTTAKYIDNLERTKEYEKSAIFGKSITAPNPILSFSQSNINNYNIPEYINYSLSIYNISNSAEIMDIPEKGTSDIHYCMDGLGFSRPSNSLKPSLDIVINGQTVNFIKYGYSAASPINGQIRKSDPAIQKVMKRLEIYTNDNSELAYYISDITNPDGDYYWIVLSRDTQQTALLNENGGRNDYLNRTSGEIAKAAPWKIYLLNAQGQSVTIKWRENLNFFESVYTDYYNNTIVNEAKVDGVSTSKGLSISRSIPLKMKSSMLENGFVRWDVKIDFSSMFVDPKKINLNYFILYLPTSLHINGSYYYDYQKNRITNSKSSTTVSTGQFLLCKHPSSNSQYDNGECSEYSPGSAGFSSYYGNDNLYNSSAFSTSTNDINLLGKKYYLNYSGFKKATLAYSSSMLSSDNTMRFSFFTRADESARESDYYSEKVYLEVIGNLFRKDYERSTNGAPEPYFNVATVGGLFFPTTNKATPKKESAEESEKNWEISASSYDTLNNVGNFENKSYGYDSYPSFFSGKYQFFDKFEVNSKYSEIIAKNTKLKSIKISTTANNSNTLPLNVTIDDYSNLEQDEEGYYTYCDTNQKCMKLLFKYGDNCTTYDSTNTECSKNEENLFNGFEMVIDGFYKAPVFSIKYSTVTDYDKVYQELKENDIKPTTITINNTATQYKWNNSEQLAISSSSSNEFGFLADLKAAKEVEKQKDTNYKNDTKKQTATITIGKNPTDYLEVVDFIDKIGSMNNNSTIIDDTATTTYNDLKEIRKYLSIKNLKISIKNHFQEEYQEIYSNHSFAEEYENSTLEIINGTNELYKLHLVKNGEQINGNTDVQITYDMNFYLDEDNSYRNNNLYTGNKFYISTNIEAKITYESEENIIGVSSNNSINPKKMSSRDGDYENKVDSINKTLICYASNSSGEIGADYLYPSTIEKNMIKQEKDTTEWEIIYQFNSSGKTDKKSLHIEDSFHLKVEGESTYNGAIINILKKYTKYKNIKIYYSKKGDNPIYELDGYLKNKDIEVDEITGRLMGTETSFNLQLESFNYGESVRVTYEIELDYEKALKEMMEKDYITSQLHLKDTDELLKVSYDNKVEDKIISENIITKSSSKISVSDYVPNVHKKCNGTQNDETSWEVRFNTGITSSSITIKDLLQIKVDEENLKNFIEEATVIKDLLIKIGEETVYEDGNISSLWEDNIILNNSNLSFEITLKDTSNHSFIKENKEVVITYKSVLDFNKYKSKQNSGVYSLENKVEMTKDGLRTMDIVESNGIQYDFPLKSTKEFLGNTEKDLTETNWKYTIETGKMDREGINIKDVVTLGSDFGKYLSISKLKITKQDEIIYDSENNINQLGDIQIQDNNQEKLILHKNGIYQFDIVIPSLEKMTTFIVEYSIKVDEENYILHDELLDKELVINNQLLVETNDGTRQVIEKRASSKVLSKMSKRFIFLGNDSNGNPKIRWYIDINLLKDYKEEELEGKTVIIKDVLSDVLELQKNTISIKRRNITSNSDTTGQMINNTLYDLETEDNTIQVTLHDPVDTNILEISFDTICVASLNEIENYATLQVGEEISEVKLANEISLFAPYVFGIISSREVLNYSIQATTLLDDQSSNRPFLFDITEVNENKEIKENGFHTQNTSSEDGTITFNPFEFDQEGLFFYKISEVDEHDEMIEYDDNSYYLRIKVVENRGKYIIEDITLLDQEEEEIVFKNYTKEIHQEEKIINNPQTRRVLLFIILPIILLIGYFMIKQKKKYS